MKTGLDLVSVVIPVYNAERQLKETLESVFSQTYPNIEVVVVDDGSKDGSLGILNNYVDRIVLVQQENRGVASARNRGVQEAKGKWIAFLDADDIWLPEKLQRQMEACQGFDWSYTDSIFIGGVNDGKRDSAMTAKRGGAVFDTLICSNFIGTSSVLIKKQVYLEFGGFDESLQSIEDWDLWIRLSSKHAVGYLDEPLVRYRVHSTSASRSTRKNLPNHMKVINSVFAPGGLAEAEQYLKRKAKSRSCSICSEIAEEEGDLRFALKCALLACVYMPGESRTWVRAIKATIKYAMSALSTRSSTRSLVCAVILAF